MKSKILDDTKKWIGRYLVLILPIIITAFLTGDSTDLEYQGKMVLLLLLFFIVLGFLTSILEYILTKDNKNKNDEIVKIFNGEKLSESKSRFRLGKYDVYCEISDDLDKDFSNLISFHVPRSQINKKKKRPNIGNVETKINGVETYEIYSGVGLSSKNLKKRLTSLLLIKNKKSKI